LTNQRRKKLRRRVRIRCKPADHGSAVNLLQLVAMVLKRGAGIASRTALAAIRDG